MKHLSDLHVQEKCHECNLRGNGFFCELPIQDVERFASIKITRGFAKGAMLFVEGQPCTGVFMLCKGRVKLSTCSREGKVIILEIVEPGDLLGLSAAISGVDHETTAEVLEPCQVNYVKTSELLLFLQTNPRASFNAARQLGRNYRTAHRQICSFGFSDSVVDKLAKLFLGWSTGDNGPGPSGAVQLRNSFTHEDIAEMIGTSRETVTRALRYFREQELLTLKGPQLVIHDRQRLEDRFGTCAGDLAIAHVRVV